MRPPSAIAVVADRNYAGSRDALRTLGWHHALAMLDSVPIVVGVAFNRQRVMRRTPILIGVADIKYLDEAMRRACDLLDDVTCQWVFACEGEALSRAQAVVAIDSSVEGHA